ncbi:hypothetical protein ACPCSE_29455 [Streptomyces cellulosae]
MTAIMNGRALAHADAYLRLNHRTRHAEILHGAQVDFVLTQVHPDRDVKPQKGGGFVVTADDWTVIQYIPLHYNQEVTRHLADSYQHWAAPHDGQKPVPQPPMSGKGLGVLAARAPGRFYRTRTDEIVHLHRGFIRNQFRPLSADDMAQAA